MTIAASHRPPQFSGLRQAVGAIRLPLVSKLPPVARTLLKTGGIAGGLGLAGYEAKPLVLAQQHHFAEAPQDDGLAPELRASITAQRRQNFENAIFNLYVKQGDGQIDWYEMADIVDHIAQNTPSDDAFRKDIWHLFGWREGQVRAPLASYLDPTNRGLPVELHNTGQQSEQMHHYLGGTTGNTSFFPSHLQNNRIYAYAYEFMGFLKSHSYNWGDVKLFNVAEKHRDSFLKNGRFVVASNMRSMLEPQPVQPTSLNSLPAQASPFVSPSRI